MTRVDALNKVASKLAYNTHQHRVAARQLPQLAENSREAEQTNIEIVEALHIKDYYLMCLGWYE